MRRVLGGAALLVGALLIVLGLMAPSLYTTLATVPLNQTSTSISAGEDMSVVRLSKEQGFQPLTGVRVTSTRKVLGIPGKATDNNAFWQTGVTSSVDGYGGISFSDEGVSIDRVSGEATNCCGDYQRADGTPEAPGEMVPVTHQGLYFKFPFDVQQQTYQWWDGDLDRAMPINFVRTEDLKGLTTYVFEQKLGPEVVGHNDGIPGDAFGSATPVSADLVYENTRTLWVEPVTGVIIKGQEQVNKRFEAAGLTSVGATVGTIGFDDATIQENVTTWSSKASALKFVKGPLRPLGLVLGLLLAGVGLWVLLTEKAAAAAGTGQGRRGTTAPTATA